MCESIQNSHIDLSHNILDGSYIRHAGALFTPEGERRKEDQSLGAVAPERTCCLKEILDAREINAYGKVPRGKMIRCRVLASIPYGWCIL